MYYDISDIAGNWRLRFKLDSEIFIFIIFPVAGMF